MNEIKPLGARVLLKIKEGSDEKKTNSGIYLATDVEMGTPVAEVVAVGELVTTLKVGDLVTLTKNWMGESIKVDLVDYKIISENDVLAVLKQS